MSAITNDARQGAGDGHQSRINTHFQSHASQWRDVYDEASVNGTIYRRRLSIVLEWIDWLAIPAERDVLEIGCGSGRYTVALAQRGHRVQAMDSVSEMLKATDIHAAEAGVSDSVSTGLGDAHNLICPDGNFELVLAIGVLPYLHSPQTALREMARVLKPGGFLLVTAGNRWRLNHLLDPWLSPPLQPAKTALKAMLRRFRKRKAASPAPPVRLDSLREVEHWLSVAGLAPIKTTTVGFPPFTFRHRPILGEDASAKSIRLSIWLQSLVDRCVPGIRATGMDYIVLAQKL